MIEEVDPMVWILTKRSLEDRFRKLECNFFAGQTFVHTGECVDLAG